MVGEDVIGFIQEFHRNSKLPQAMISSFLALIPKIDNPQGLDEYTPIYLIGCMYKVISKILASRMRKVIRKIVSSTQTTFINGRQILDGVLLVTNEIIDYASRENKKSCYSK